MRWVLDVVGLLMVMALLAGVLYFRQESNQEQATFDRAAGELRRMELEIKYRAAARQGDLNARGWPKTIEASWFEGTPPRNILLDAERPWLEIAPPEQAGLQDPPVRMGVNAKLAGFWYNPYLGIIRARVPVMVSDTDAADMYNRLNGTNLASIFQQTPVDDVTAAAAMEGSGDQDDDLDPTKPRKNAGGNSWEISVTGKVKKRITDEK